MITNLFSIFDPSTNILNLSLNWFRLILGILLIPFSFWLIPNNFLIIYYKILRILFKEFKVVINNKINRTVLILVSLFSFIFLRNFIRLFPYIFTGTRHLVLNLTLAIPLWLSFLIFGWLNKTHRIFTHLVPQGTPLVLIPFIVCIETIRNVIRPGTLAVRLAANIIAGHLLLTLLGNTGPSLSYIIVSLLLIGQIALLILESAVAIIQSYVFAVLRTLYSSEVN